MWSYYIFNCLNIWIVLKCLFSLSMLFFSIYIYIYFFPVYSAVNCSTRLLIYFCYYSIKASTIPYSQSNVLWTGAVCIRSHNSRCTTTHTQSHDDTLSAKGKLPTFSHSACLGEKLWICWGAPGWLPLSHSHHNRTDAFWHTQLHQSSVSNPNPK